MKERPIIFNGEMVRAILDGRKTQTRRIIKPQPILGGFPESLRIPGITLPQQVNAAWQAGFIDIHCPLGQIGDHLWVRETWRRYSSSDECGCSESPCQCPANGTVLFRASQDDGESKWKPSIHMPRWACRIILEITNVRVERLQDISKEDAKAEGFDCPPDPTMDFKFGARHNFLFTWDQIYGNRSENPWVWVIEFKVLTTNGVITEAAA